MIYLVWNLRKNEIKQIRAIELRFARGHGKRVQIFRGSDITLIIEKE